MKPNIHPQFNTAVTMSCACGVSFVTGSTVTEMHTEICSSCHPFYTGTAKFIDTAGRVDKFKAKMARAQEFKAKKEKKSPAGESKKSSDK